MLTKNQILILNLFRKNIFLKSSILQIAKKINKKSYQRVYEAVKDLEKKKILKLEKLGNTNLISLSLNSYSISQIAFLEEQEAIRLNIPNYEKLMSIKEISQYLIIVTGSYVKEKATKTSDLDLVLVIPNDQKAIDIQKLVENLTLVYHPPIHLYVFNNKDFIEMLLEKQENYGKETFRNHIILKNAYIYYELIKEAIEYGFKE
jgi:predicted nucleotidyltransferase